MRILSSVKSALSRFRRETDGSMSAEAMIILPLLTWWFVASFVFFDAFRTQNTNLKGAYTIADMISREPEIDCGYIDGLNTVFDFLVHSNHPTWIRVTSVYWDETNKVYKQSWSRATKGKPIHTDTTINAMKDHIPEMPVGDTVIVVETSMAYEPAFSVWLDAFRFTNFIVTRPRFASQVAFVPCA